MKIPTKFEVNTEDFKVAFDNQKKTHICENLDTGEKTNIGVLGILMQMGIIKPIDGAVEEKIKTLSERLNELETKINDIIKKINSVSTETEEAPEEVEVEEEVKPKSEMNERIMKKVLETTKRKPRSEPEDELDEDEVEIEEIEAKSDVAAESEEEIKNWMDI